MAKHRKSSRSVLYQVRWWNGRQWHLAQVRGEKQRERLKTTLAALPWVSEVEDLKLSR